MYEEVENGEKCKNSKLKKFKYLKTIDFVYSTFGLNFDF